MTDRQEEQNIADLAHRADPLIDRRAMIARSSRRLALPLLVSLCVTREAMGQTGSGGHGKGGSGEGGGNHHRRRRRSRRRSWRRFWNSGR